MKKYFICSDIHSFYYEWMRAMIKKGFDRTNDDHIVVILGDLFDRGPSAKDCYEFAKGMADKDRLIYIKGNHEDLLVDYYEKMRKGHGRDLGRHHITNGTADTVNQFSFPATTIKSIKKNILPVIDFIMRNASNFAMIGKDGKKFLLVHGWFPSGAYWKAGDWSNARWKNGMEEWAKGNRMDGTTVVCGHYHTSWGWSRLRNERPEFPTKGAEGWEASFEPFIDDGIIAIDACTAYSGIVNCVVITEEGEVEAI